jgi:hypothetical protein
MKGIKIRNRKGEIRRNVYGLPVGTDWADDTSLLEKYKSKKKTKDLIRKKSKKKNR